MPKGLALPVGVDSTGGARLVDGDENDNKIVLLSLGDDTSENAFQQGIGLGPFPIFEINDALARPQVLARIRQIFARFKALRRYELVEDSLRWLTSEDDDFVEEGMLVLEFKYISLEANEQRLFRTKVSTSNAGVGG